MKHTIDPDSIVGADQPYPRPQPSQARSAPNAQVAELQVYVEQLQLRGEAMAELISALTRRMTGLESKVARLENEERQSNELPAITDDESELHRS